MSDVFISYARSTAKQAQQVAGALRALGYGVWRDDELPAHRDYSEVIEERLRAAKAVVVVWSAEAVKSQWVRAEADLAREAGTLVQLSLDGAPLPMPFNRIQYADLADWTGDLEAPGWRKVAASVAALMGSSPSAAAATPGPTPPLERRLAVLAFDNLSPDPEMSFFSDGVSEEILETVSRNSDLTVIGRASSFQFRGPQKAARHVAAELSVTHVLDGAVRRSGDRVRISAQLVECHSETRLWSERFDRDLSDVFALQDEIAGAVAAALEAAFRPAAAPAQPINPSAYDLYLKARDFTATPIVSDKADMLERAVALAPDFTQAWALLAHVRLTQARQGGQRHEFARLLDRARAALDMAERLDASLGVTRTTRADLEPYAAFARREALLQEALKLTPGDAQCLIAAGQFLAIVGRRREARAFADEAIARDPLFPPAFDLHVGVWGESYQALQAWWDGVRAKWPAFFPFSVGAAWSAAVHGDWPKYEELVRHARAQPFSDFQQRQMRGTLAVCEALRKNDRAYSDQMLAGMESDLSRTGSFFLDGTWSLAMFGRLEEVFALVERASFQAVLQPLGRGLTSGWSPALLFSPGVNDAMMHDPRFVRLCAKLGLVSYWLDTGKWPDCADAVPYDFRAEARKTAADGLARRV
jgi:TolB-like protein